MHVVNQLIIMCMHVGRSAGRQGSTSEVYNWPGKVGGLFLLTMGKHVGLSALHCKMCKRHGCQACVCMYAVWCLILPNARRAK